MVKCCVICSRPVLEFAVEANEEDFLKARFAKGVMAPKGAIYYPVFIPEAIDYEYIVPKTIFREWRFFQLR